MLYLSLFLGLVLRLINLNQSLWLDEAIQAWASSNFNLDKLLTQFMPTDVHPPLSYLVSLLTGKLIGFSEVSLRLPSVIFGVLTIYIIFKLAKILKFKNPAIPSLFLATSGLHLYYSQEARMYSLTTLLVSLSLYYLIKSFTHQKNLFLFSIFSLLSFYTHYYAFFMLPVYFSVIFLSKPRKTSQYFLSLLLLVLGFLPWLPTLLIQLKGGLTASLSNSSWANTVGGLNLKSLSLIPIKFLIGRISFDNKTIYALVASIPLLITTYLFYLLFKNLKKTKSTAIIVSWLLIPLSLAVIVSIKLPVLSFHRFLFILPAFYLCLSLGLNQLIKPFQSILTTLFLVFNLITSGIYLFNSRHHRENWQALARQLIARNTTQAPVAVLAPVKTPLTYYYAGDIINYTDITSDFNQPEVWLVPYAEPLFDPKLTTKQTLNQLGFKEKYQKHFRGDLILIQYTNENWN